ncbi:YicC family protein [Candidatus Babeliales bacterium]|nr:YicC family protein [Candidatus Babeliales bacterium]
MIQSMTGFATKTVTLSLPNDETVDLTFQLKSLNSRFFECTCKLPVALSSMETDLIQLLKKHLKRGHVFFSVTANNQTLLRGPIQPSMSVAEAYIDAANALQEAFDIPGDLTVSTLLQLPNVLSIHDQGLDQSVTEKIQDIIHDLLRKLIERRQQEGDAMLKDLEDRHAILQEAITDIETHAEKIMAEKKESIAHMLHELNKSDSKESDNHRSTMYYELNKVDINEEIVRFKSHLKTLHKVFSSAQVEKGKHLDFILQELARETNTIAAKASSALLSERAVTIKVELEKIREQTQNIV